jgi:hypothetical protein
MIPLVNVTTVYGACLAALGFYGVLTADGFRLVALIPAALSLPLFPLGYLAGIRRWALSACLVATVYAAFLMALTGFEPIMVIHRLAGPDFLGTQAARMLGWTNLLSLLYVFSSLGWLVRRKLGILGNI